MGDNTQNPGQSNALYKGFSPAGVTEQYDAKGNLVIITQLDDNYHGPPVSEAAAMAAYEADTTPASQIIGNSEGRGTYSDPYLGSGITAQSTFNYERVGFYDTADVPIIADRNGNVVDREGPGTTSMGLVINDGSYRDPATKKLTGGEGVLLLDPDGDGKTDAIVHAANSKVTVYANGTQTTLNNAAMAETIQTEISMDLAKDADGIARITRPEANALGQLALNALKASGLDQTFGKLQMAMMDAPSAAANKTAPPGPASARTAANGASL